LVRNLNQREQQHASARVRGEQSKANLSTTVFSLIHYNHNDFDDQEDVVMTIRPTQRAMEQ
jgi:hypothetical protein